VNDLAAFNGDQAALYLCGFEEISGERSEHREIKQSKKLSRFASILLPEQQLAVKGSDHIPGAGSIFTMAKSKCRGS
jgi:hypothetical protein